MTGRRRFLRAAGAVAIAGVAGCSDVVPDFEDATPTVPPGWSAAPPLPAPQSDVGSGVLDGRLYAFGGIETGQGLAAVARTFSYDPATEGADAWRRHEAMPRALWGNCGVATDDALFSFGGAPTDSPYRTGTPPSDAIFVFRPDEGWENLSETEGAHCPYRNWAMRGVYNPADGLIYCVGGATNVSVRDTATNHGARVDAVGAYDEYRVWTFDPAARRVVDDDFARLPAAKRWPTVALVEVDGDPVIHAIGGLLGNSGPTDSNVRIDPATGEVATARPTPLPGTYATNTNPVIDGEVYLSHGLFTEGAFTMDSYRVFCHRYDPAADEFETGLPDAAHVRVGAADGVVDGALHVVGGHVKPYDGDGGHDAVTHHEVFRPPPDGTTGTADRA